ncbi:hypothetical protein [Thermaurantiacus tibetensis]|uniref:hypothetical protein n=1 Tax=Thermaurantiacus tibetensis TaxID=2759035 RepID=UPI001F3569CF|nr:hypothetical protein [Thermaurantiacus tibetensis]
MMFEVKYQLKAASTRHANWRKAVPSSPTRPRRTLVPPRKVKAVSPSMYAPTSKSITRCGLKVKLPSASPIVGARPDFTITAGVIGSPFASTGRASATLACASSRSLLCASSWRPRASSASRRRRRPASCAEAEAPASGAAIIAVAAGHAVRFGADVIVATPWERGREQTPGAEAPAGFQACQIRLRLQAAQGQAEAQTAQVLNLVCGNTLFNQIGKGQFA